MSSTIIIQNKSFLDYFDQFITYDKIQYLLRSNFILYFFSMIMIICGLILIIQNYRVDTKDLITLIQKENHELFHTIGILFLFMGLIGLCIARSLQLQRNYIRN